MFLFYQIYLLLRINLFVLAFSVARTHCATFQTSVNTDFDQRFLHGGILNYVPKYFHTQKMCE